MKALLYILYIAFLLLCLLGCDKKLDYYSFTNSTGLEINDVENKTFSKYENNVFIEKWKFGSDAIVTPTVSILHTIQGSVFILGNSYLKNNYSYKATGSKGIISSIEFTKILLPKDSVVHSFKLIRI